MNFKTYDLITNISALSSLIPLIVFVRAIWRKKQPNSVKLLGLLSLIASLTELATLILYEAYRINPNPVVNVYVLLQLVLVILVFRSAYTKPLFKTLAALGITLFIAFAVIDVFFLKGITAINANLFTVSAMASILYSALYFYQLVEELSEPFIERIFMFWFSTSVFLYFGTNLFLFATVDQLIKAGVEQFMLSWGLHNGTNILKNILFAIGLYVTILKPKKLPEQWN